MLALNSAISSSIDTIKDHGKNLSKVIAISNQAYHLIQQNNTVELPIKLNQIYEITAHAVGFKTLASLQAHVSQNKAVLSAQLDVDAVVSTLTSLVDMEVEKSIFIAKHIVEYITKSGLMVVPNHDTPKYMSELWLYLPLLRYVHVSDFHPILRDVVKNSFTFEFANAELSDLTTSMNFPLSGWIDLCVMNNMLPGMQSHIHAQLDTANIYYSDIFGGSPRLSCHADSENFLAQPSALGTDYFRVIRTYNDNIFIPTPDQLSKGITIKDIKLNHPLLLKFAIGSRTKNLFLDYSKITVQRDMLYDLYGFKPKMDAVIQSIANVRIFEASEYFLKTATTHLKALNSVLHHDNRESKLQVRPEVVNELSWRVHIVDYAEQVIELAKSFVRDMVVNQDEVLDLEKIYFNDFGLLMFAFDSDVEVQLPKKWFHQTFTPYNFSIFFNVFANFLITQSDLTTKVHNKHLTTMSYAVFQVAKELMSFPIFQTLNGLFNLDTLQDAIYLSINRLDMIDNRISHYKFEGELTTGTNKHSKSIYLITVDGLRYETLFLGLVHQYRTKKLDLSGVIRRVMLGEIESVFTLSETESYLPKVGNFFGLPYNLDSRKATYQDHIQLMEKYHQDSLGRYDLSKVVIWLVELMQAEGYVASKKIIDAIHSQDINQLMGSMSSVELITLLGSTINKQTKSAWNDQTLCLISALTPILVYLRDIGEIQLSPQTYMEYLELSKIEALVFDHNGQFGPKFDAKIETLKTYIINLPSYNPDLRGNQPKSALEQHGFNCLVMSQIFSELASGLQSKASNPRFKTLLEFALELSKKPFLHIDDQSRMNMFKKLNVMIEKLKF